MDYKSREQSEQSIGFSKKLKLNPSHTFISTTNSSYSYGDLIGFAEELKAHINKVTDHSNSFRILVLADKSIRTAFVISACFLNQIPIVVLPADSSSDQILRRINETEVFAVLDNNLKKEIDPILPLIKVPDIKNYTELNSNLEYSTFELEKLFAILFTSGTTSDAKAVPLKFKHILNAAKNSSQNLPLEINDEWLLNLPLHHVGGISVLIRSILAGSKVFLCPITKTSELKEVFLKRTSLTHASLVPTQLKRLLDDPEFKVGSNFKAILLGGGPIPVSVLQPAKQRSVPVIPSFGMTETAAQCIAVPYNFRWNTTDGTSGKPLGNMKVSLRRDSDGNANLLWVKGDQLFDGYLDERLNKHSFDSDGWFNTGDYARIDENGLIYIEMRRSDRIVSGGENINPFILEEVIESHELVAEACVFGIPDDEWGQIVCAAVVLDDNNQSLTLDDINIFLKPRLQGYMIPKKLLLVDKLPRTSTGKLIRTDLEKLI